MAIKDWLAKLAGPKGYGGALGRTASEGASGLANAVFMSHATAPGTPATIVFDDATAMSLAGFTERYLESTKIDLLTLTSEEKVLFKNLHTAMFCFAYVLNVNAAKQYMRPTSASKFNKGFAPSLLHATVDSRLFPTAEAAQAAVDPYFAACDSTPTGTVLNFETPASGDLLEHLISTSVDRSEVQLQFGFARSGPTGFGTTAIAIAEEILKSIFAATRHYNW